LVALPALGHRLAPSLLELVEAPAGGGRVAVTWKSPLQQPAGSDVRPELPGHCAPVGEPTATKEGTGLVLRSEIDCGSEGLVGQTVRVAGLDAGGANALVRVVFADGRRAQAVLHAGEASFTLPAQAQPLEVAWGYLRLGFDHILGGLDHLVFVLGLIALVTATRPLLYTVTAFTLGHSVTLSLAALGFVRFPSDLVEIVIAFTILVVALELTRPVAGAAQPSLMRRFPWAIAFGFGLLHGFGFAGALAEIGLPDGEIPLALLCFNVGIEIGQLAFVCFIWALRTALHKVEAALPEWAGRIPAYGMGGLAVYWCLDRTAGLLS
jgi:hypothetical protein